MHYIFTRVIVDETQIYVFHPNPQELVELRHELDAAQQARDWDFFGRGNSTGNFRGKVREISVFNGRYSIIPRLGGIFICNYPNTNLFQVSEF